MVKVTVIKLASATDAKYWLRSGIPSTQEILGNKRADTLGVIVKEVHACSCSATQLASSDTKNIIEVWWHQQDIQTYSGP